MMFGLWLYSVGLLLVPPFVYVRGVRRKRTQPWVLQTINARKNINNNPKKMVVGRRHKNAAPGPIVGYLLLLKEAM